MQRLFRKLKPRLYRRLVLAALIFWIPLVVFIVLAEDVHDKEPVLFDQSVTQWLLQHSNATFEQSMQFITHGGDTLTILLASLLIASYLYYKRRWLEMMAAVVSVGGAGLINLALKLAFQRDRPSVAEALVVEHGFSFPSGHAMGAAALGMLLVALTWRSRHRWLVRLAAGLYISLIGVSRVYLGVHYPSDVVAGAAVSTIWVGVVFYALEHPAISKGWQKNAKA